MSDLHNTRLRTHSNNLKEIASTIYGHWKAGGTSSIHDWQELKQAIGLYNDSIMPYVRNRQTMLHLAENQPLATSIKVWQAAYTLYEDWIHGVTPTDNLWLALGGALDAHEAVYSPTPSVPSQAA